MLKRHKRIKPIGRFFLEITKEHYWSLCNKYLAETTGTQTHMLV